METTAGMTRAATSANDGMVTEVTGPLVVWMGDVCALDFFISPRSALTTMPKATEAMMMATVDRMRLVDWFIGRLLLWTLLRCFYRVVWKSPAAVFGASAPYCLPACSASASGRMVAAVHLLVTSGEGEGFRG